MRRRVGVVEWSGLGSPLGGKQGRETRSLELFV
jgi:hypothetical protein